MTIKASSYPTSRPTLDLNFAQTKRLDPRVTFTRSSTGSYFDANGVLQSAATNTARFDHNPATGESLGLLVEEARTNSNTYSEYLNPTYGGAFGTSQLNAALAPNNTFTATQITQGSSGGWVSPGAGTWTYSIFVKQGTSPTFRLVYAGYGATDWTFTFATEVFSVHGDWSNASVQKLPNGWYRLTATTANRGAYYFYLYTSSSSTTALIWGLQLEAASFPTSYIPTPATFTSRASSATYYDASGVIQTAGTNVARSAAFFPDSNGVMRSAGLLLEAAGTNLLLRSQEIDNTTAWAGSYKLNYSANATTAPDGTATADKVIPNTENVSHSTTQDPAGTISGTYTFSLYAKASGYNKIALWIDGASAGGLFGSGSAVFDLSTKAITSISGSATIETLPNGWYRCSVTGTSASAVTVSTGFGIYDNSGNSTFAGNGTDGIFIWGAQLEASPYPTSYIATTTATVTRSADVSSSATVTRSADVAQITGTNFSSWYRQDEGTVALRASTPNKATHTFLNLLNAASPTSNRVIITPQNAYTFAVQQGSVFGAQYDDSSFVSSATSSSAYALKANNVNWALNGTIKALDTSVSIPIVDRLYLASDVYGANNSTGVYARLTYWPTRLSDATLQAITL